MARTTQRLMYIVLLLGLIVVLWAAFSSSEHTLTLALGGLFATALGLVMMMQPAERSRSGTHLTTERMTGSQQQHDHAAERLPDPLDMNLDIPL
jgi:hypothetical protein